VSELIQIATAQEELPRTRLSHLLGIGRATLYRHVHAAPAAEQDVEVRHRIQQIALEMPAYGYRRITAQLHREGIGVNHKRVLRVMREDNLLCLRTRPFVRTTDSDHGYAVYPNLVPTLDVRGLDRLWIADITYVRLRYEFIYLAVVLDAFSRRCIGWCLERHLRTELTLAALRMALATRAVGPGLVHHSDRGVQYAAHAYTDLLTAHGIQISMSRRANPYDNAQAESFMKTLKYEEVHVNDYETLEEARASIGHFLETVYNQKRLHSALGYCPPAEFEAALTQAISP
jgi:transposase InsO family protein